MVRGTVGAVPDILRAVRGVLGIASYRRLLAAYALNELAWSVGSLALALLVYRRTGSAFGAMGFFLSAQFLPAFFSPVLVARLDRHAVRRVLPVLYVLQALAFVGLTWLAGDFELVAVLVLTLVCGVVGLAARAIARAATAAVLSPLRLLREGNAVTNAVFAVCIMVGPALGGALVLAGGSTAALLFNAAVFGVIALAVGLSGGLPGRSPAASRPRRGYGPRWRLPAETSASERCLSSRA